MRLTLSLFALTCFALGFFALTAVPGLEAATPPTQPAPVSPSTATWSVLDSDGRYLGFATSRSENGGQRWAFYEAGEPPVLAAAGTTHDRGDGHQDWLGDETLSGRVALSPDGLTGTWTLADGAIRVITYLGP